MDRFLNSKCRWDIISIKCRGKMCIFLTSYLFNLLQLAPVLIYRLVSAPFGPKLGSRMTGNVRKKLERTTDREW